MKLYDVFICHASEDKEVVARPLAELLAAAHLEVWYDEFSLTLGDSLRRSIDRGLARSRYGVVVLSPNFFAKEWPQRELDGLVARETVGQEKVVLPVWHQITKKDLCDQSPLLADLYAASTADGLDIVVEHILRVVRPRGSPLIIARDTLIELGLSPPVVTDDWWLDIVEASHREPPCGFIPKFRPWDRWFFPLPEDEGTPLSRGERLARTAVQVQWEQEARERRLSQITPPNCILEFIAVQPGLRDVCLQYPHFLATYAPQLTIPGLGGEFDAVYESMLRTWRERIASAEAAGVRPEAVPSYLVLRDPQFGSRSAEAVLQQFVSGELAGPPCRVYSDTEYLVWLLSDDSKWLTARVRDCLLDGMSSSRRWMWFDSSLDDEYPGHKSMGALARSLGRVKSLRDLQLGAAAQNDLRGRFEAARAELGLHQPLDELISRFLSGPYVESYVRHSLRQRRPR